MKRFALRMLRSLDHFIRWFILLPLLSLVSIVLIPLALLVLAICYIFNPNLFNNDPGGY